MNTAGRGTGRTDLVRRVAVVALVGAALGSCSAAGGVPSTPSIRALGPGEQWLRWYEPGICAGGGTVGEFRLRGSPSDPLLVWATFPDGRREQLSWSPGTSARFTPQLEVMGPDGQVIARDGASITGTCTIAGQGLVAEFGPSPFIPGADAP